MAVFTPFNSDFAVDTRLLVAWRKGFTIDSIDGSGTNTLTVTDNLSPNDLVLTYTGSTTMTATGTVPGAGTFESIIVSNSGTLSGISPAAVFGDIVNDNAYKILDGADTINGSTAKDDLFAGFGGNDTFDGNGGGDNFHLGTRASPNPVLTIKGAIGAVDTIFVEKNLAGDEVLSLTQSTLTSIDAITLGPGAKLVIDSNQVGGGIATNAVIGAFSGTAGLDINVVSGAGAFDAASLQVNPNTLLRIFGTSAAETISGTENGDHFFGRQGADTLNGRDGNDTFWLEGAGDEFDKINGGSGVDTVVKGGTAVVVLNGFNAKTASIEAWVGEVSGNAGNNTFDFRGLTAATDLAVRGGDGNDTMMAPSLGMTMLGEAGKDSLIGAQGEDFLFGGLGADTLTGGGEADFFIYTDVKESGRKKSLRDTITDFDGKSDKILMAVDANKGKKEFQAFKFVKKEGGPFKKKPGSLIWEQIDKPGGAKDMTVIYGDNNGDRKADIAIQFKGLVDLKADDIVFGLP